MLIIIGTKKEWHLNICNWPRLAQDTCVIYFCRVVKTCVFYCLLSIYYNITHHNKKRGVMNFMIGHMQILTKFSDKLKRSKTRTWLIQCLIYLMCCSYLLISYFTQKLSRNIQKPFFITHTHIYSFLFFFL